MAHRALDEDERKAPGASARQKTQDEWLPYFDWLGIAARLSVYGFMFFLTWQWLPSPSDPLFDRPLSSLSLNDIGRLVFPVLVFLFLLQSLCEPSQIAERRQTWSWIGVYMIVAGIIAAIIAGGLYLLRVPMTVS
jgi:hypothetical protein